MMKEKGTFKYIQPLLVLMLFWPVLAYSQDLKIEDYQTFNQKYADSILWERINDIRKKHHKKPLPHSFMVRKYISSVNAEKLKQKNSCFHPHWSFTDKKNTSASKYIYQEMQQYFKLPQNKGELGCSNFSYSEVAAATWGYHFETYDEMARYFAQMWWDSKGHREILYNGDYNKDNADSYMIGVSIKKSGENYYGIANVIGYYP